MKTIKICFLVILSILVTSCATKHLQSVKPRERMQLDGFTFGAPISEGWVVVKKTDSVILLAKSTPQSGNHTVVASLTIVDIGTPDLLSYVKSAMSQKTTRHRMVESDISVKKLNYMDCVYVNYLAEDRDVPESPGKTFNLTGEGYYCPHPHSPQSRVAMIDYSQRFLATESPLPTDIESSIFIRSLKFILLNK